MPPAARARVSSALVLATIALAVLCCLGAPRAVEAQARTPERTPPAARRGRTRTPAAEAPPQSPAERARALLGEADFEGALAAANEAEAATDLDRDGLIALLESRVLIESGLGRQADVDRDLARLAALAPGRPAPASFPPPVAQRLVAAQASAVAPRLDPQVRTTDDGAGITCAAADDPTGLVRSVRLAARTGDGAWQTSDTGSLAVAVEPGQTLQYYATGIGPGGAVVAAAGSEAEPLTRTRALPRAVLPDPEPAAAASDDTGLFIGLGVGGGVVVLGVVIVIAVVAGSSNDSTLVTLPTER